MKIHLVGSSIPDTTQNQFAISYLVNETVAIDAGCIGFMSSVDDQRKIKHVFISHSHMDHIASLPMFLDNVYVHGPASPTVYASTAVQECLKDDIFNERVWPDMIRLSSEESPFLRIETLDSGNPVTIEGLKITPVDVNHVVPTLGFIIDDGQSAVVIVGDTGPTDDIWRIAGQIPHLKAVVLEACFPNAMAWLAEKAKHLTPEMFQDSFRRLDRDIRMMAVHVKASCRDDVRKELHELEMPELEIAELGIEYEF